MAFAAVQGRKMAMNTAKLIDPLLDFPKHAEFFIPKANAGETIF